MRKASKRYRAASEKIDRKKLYTIDEALDLLLETATAKFDETVQLSFRLGVDPRHADQQVRSTVLLPHGVGRKVRVLAFCEGEKAQEAKEAGADVIGSKDLVEKIQKENFLDFEKAVATPDMMRHVGRIGKILGPRGLMPNPKTQTVTWDIGKAIKELKKGKVEFRTDKQGNVHLPIGKISMGKEKLRENLYAALEAVQRAKPPASRGAYFRSITLSAAMGPGIRLDPYKALLETKKKVA